MPYLDNLIGVKKSNYVKINKYEKCIYQSYWNIGACLRVFLTRKQDKALFSLRKEDLPNKVRTYATRTFLVKLSDSIDLLISFISQDLQALALYFNICASCHYIVTRSLSPKSKRRSRNNSVKCTWLVCWKK